MSKSFSVAKIWFLLSLSGLIFLYGVEVGKYGYFPSSFLDRAVDQARAFTYSFEKDFSHTRVFDRHGARTLKPERMQPGVTSIVSWWDTPKGPEVGMKIIDKTGKVLHEWSVDRTGTFGQNLSERKGPTETDIQGSLLLPGGDVIANLEYVGVARINSCGKVLWTLTEGAHHSIAQADDGSFWIPGVSQSLRNGTQRNPDLPGLGPIWVDRILNVSREGDVLEKINLVDIIYENGLDRFFFTHGKRKWDVTHLNDIEPLSSSLAGEYPLFDAGDLLLSLRHINLVLVVDPKSKKVKWHTSSPFIEQHDPDFIGEGWIGIFDNNTGRGKVTGQGSRIVALQPHTDSTKILFQPSRVDRFYTRHRGKWQMLKNGNMLLTEEGAGRALEVSPEGKMVWEWIHEPNGSRVPSLSKATRHDLNREEIASWPCSSIDSVNTSSKKQQTAP